MGNYNLYRKQYKAKQNKIEILEFSIFSSLLNDSQEVKIFLDQRYKSNLPFTNNVQFSIKCIH